MTDSDEMDGVARACLRLEGLTVSSVATSFLVEIVVTRLRSSGLGAVEIGRVLSSTE